MQSASQVSSFRPPTSRLSLGSLGSDGPHPGPPPPPELSCLLLSPLESSPRPGRCWGCWWHASWNTGSSSGAGNGPGPGPLAALWPHLTSPGLHSLICKWGIVVPALQAAGRIKWDRCMKTWQAADAAKARGLCIMWPSPTWPQMPAGQFLSLQCAVQHPGTWIWSVWVGPEILLLCQVSRWGQDLSCQLLGFSCTHCSG